MTPRSRSPSGCTRNTVRRLAAKVEAGGVGALLPATVPPPVRIKLTEEAKAIVAELAGKATPAEIAAEIATRTGVVVTSRHIRRLVAGLAQTKPHLGDDDDDPTFPGEGHGRVINKFIVPALAVLALFTGACSSSKTTSSSPSPPAASPSSSGAVVAAASSPLGQILVDGSGRTLYLFLADTGTSSTCTGPCATAWPPLLTKGAPVAGSGATASDLGTTKRGDGTTQVTYAGHPLYYYVADTKPGQMTGQALNQFGALWYVLSPTGSKITTAPGSASP